MKPVRVITSLFLAWVSIFGVSSARAYEDSASRTSRLSEHRYNVRLSPISALVGIADLAVDYRLDDKITVGPSLTYLNVNISDITVKGSAVGIQGNYFFDGAFKDGWVANAGLNYINMQASARSRITNEIATATGSGLNYQVGFGYGWFWQNFNLNLGGNLGSTTMNKVEVKDSTGTTVEDYRGNLSTGIDFKIGYAF